MKAMDLRLLRGMGSFKRQIRPVMTLLTTMWKVSPAGTTISLLFLILKGTMPALQLWLLKQLIDSVVAFAKGESLGHALRWLGLYVGGTVTLTSLGVAGSSITTWVRERTSRPQSRSGRIPEFSPVKPRQNWNIRDAPPWTSPFCR